MYCIMAASIVYLLGACLTAYYGGRWLKYDAYGYVTPDNADMVAIVWPFIMPLVLLGALFRILVRLGERHRS